MRITLIKPNLRYLNDIYAVYSSPKVVKYLAVRRHATKLDTLRDIRKRIKDWHEKKRFNYMIKVRKTGSIIGYLSVTISGHRANIGYAINQEYWGQGYCSESIRIIVKRLLKRKIRRIWATVDPENKTSIRTLIRNGFKKEAILRDWEILPNISPLPRNAISFIYSGKRHDGEGSCRHLPPSLFCIDRGHR